MVRLNPQKLHVQFAPGYSPEDPLLPRAYTLTHSDTTGDLFLTIGPTYEQTQISGWYTRIMRDEVLAAWSASGGTLKLEVYCHVSGGIVLGGAGWRYQIFQRHLQQVLEAFRYGDRQLFLQDHRLDKAPIIVHFKARQKRYNLEESWGKCEDYRIKTA